MEKTPHNKYDHSMNAKYGKELVNSIRIISGKITSSVLKLKKVKRREKKKGKTKKGLWVYSNIMHHLRCFYYNTTHLKWMGTKTCIVHFKCFVTFLSKYASCFA